MRRGRRVQSYITKYGPVAGPIIYRLLQSQAAHARWHRARS